MSIFSKLFSYVSNGAVAATLVGMVASFNGDVKEASAEPMEIDLTSPIYLQFGAAVAPYAGFTDYCKRESDLCQHKSAGASVVTLDKQMFTTIEERNKLINELIGAAEDQENFGNEEYWSEPEESGDCEDFVLAKMKDFNDVLGIPMSAMSIVGVNIPVGLYEGIGGGHAILVIHTDNGDFVADNLNDELFRVDYVFSVNGMGYLPMKASSFEDISRWKKLEDPFANVKAEEDEVYDLIEKDKIKPVVPLQGIFPPDRPFKP